MLMMISLLRDIARLSAASEIISADLIQSIGILTILVRFVIIGLIVVEDVRPNLHCIIICIRG
jgi:hypothetical protein